MTPSRRHSFLEPLSLIGASLVGSGALWGRLWVTSPTTRGICGCGDPALFQWFLAWPAHAMRTSHSLAFSRDLFTPHGINLLANTSVLALGVPLAPLTWWRGPLFTENVALLLAVPFAVWTMDLFLRRVTASVLARVVLSLVFGFSPFVLVSLVVGHLMTAWIGVLPLICLGVVDSLAADRYRAHRGQALLCVSLVAQFFLSAELLVLGVLTAVVTLLVLGCTWACSTSVPRPTRASVARLAWPLVSAAVLLAVPASYALFGSRRLSGRIWGPAFTPSANGTSLLALVAPASSKRSTLAISGYLGHPPVNLQYLGWGLVAATVLVAAWRWRDPVVRTATAVAALCALLALSPASFGLAPWRWLGSVPILENVLQRRIIVFSLLACLVIVARGIDAAARHGRRGTVVAVLVLTAVVASIAVPEAGAVPFRTVAVSAPAWWRQPPTGGVVLSYPFPGNVIESPLSWQARSNFAVSIVGGSGPQSLPSRAGTDRRATEALDALTFSLTRRVELTASTVAALRGMVLRDRVTDVVVPVSVSGGVLAAGGTPSARAAVLFAEALGLVPRIERDAWVFDLRHGLRAPHVVTAAEEHACATVAQVRPSSVARCLGLGGAQR